MQKKLLIPILAVLVIVIVLITRGCGKKDTKQEARQEEPQDTVADPFDDASAAGNDVRAQFGTSKQMARRRPIPIQTLRLTRGMPMRSTMLFRPV